MRETKSGLRMRLAAQRAVSNDLKVRLEGVKAELYETEEERAGWAKRAKTEAGLAARRGRLLHGLIEALERWERQGGELPMGVEVALRQAKRGGSA